MARGERFRISIRVIAHHRLQQRGRHLKGEGDQPDLREAQVKRIFDDRIKRRDGGLNGIVQQMAEADRCQDGQNRPAGGIDACRRFSSCICRCRNSGGKLSATPAVGKRRLATTTCAAAPKTPAADLQPVNFAAFARTPRNGLAWVQPSSHQDGANHGCILVRTNRKRLRMVGGWIPCRTHLLVQTGG